MRTWLIPVFLIATIVASSSADAAKKAPLVFERQKGRGVCVRLPGQICTLYTISLAQRRLDEGRLYTLPPGVPTFQPSPSIVPSQEFLQYAKAPAYLQQKYALPSSPIAPPSNAPTAAPVTIMIVDYTHDPVAEYDMNVFRKQFNLPQCTIASGCFTMWNTSGTKENPNDPSTYPALDTAGGDGSIQAETSTDLDAASTLCPTCHIALVEVDFNQENYTTYPLFFKGVGVAKIIHPDVVSLSYAWPEQQVGGNDALVATLRVPIMASSGDGGYEQDNSTFAPVGFPAASRYVTAVGGTDFDYYSGALNALSGISGSGCSSRFPVPAFQISLHLCGGRAISDISAESNYLPVYDSYCPPGLTQNGGTCGWFYGNGTSLSAPLVASLYASAAQVVKQLLALASQQHCTAAQIARIHAIPMPGGLYAQPQTKFTTVVGLAGFVQPCPIAIFCTEGAGWHGPGGFGNPNSYMTFFKGSIRRGPYPAPPSCSAAYDPILGP
jgi:hypothetical protein